MKLIQDQKSVLYMMDFVGKFIKQGELFVDFSARTFEVATELLLPPKHLCFVSCDILDALIEGSK